MKNAIPLRWVIVGLLFAATAISYIDRQTLSVVAPILREELGISNVGYAQMLSAFLLAYTVMQAATGWLIDRLGTRRGFAIIMIWWSVAAVLHAFGEGVISFSVYRFLLGAGEAGSWAACVKAVSEWFPPKERGFANSLWSAGVSAGQVVSVPLVAWIAVTLNWRYSFIITGMMGFMWLVAWLKLYRRPGPEGDRAAASTATAGEVRPTEPRIPYLRLLRWRNVWAIFLARVLADPCIWFYNYWIPEYLKRDVGLSIADIGRYGWIPFLTMGVGVLLGGPASDLLCRRGMKVLSARLSVMAVGALLMAPGTFAALDLSVGAAFAAISIATFGFGLWAPNMMTLHADAFPHRVVGSVTGLSGVGAGLGGIAFTMGAGWALDTLGFAPVFLAVGSIPLVAFAVLYFLLDRRTAETAAVPGTLVPLHRTRSRPRPGERGCHMKISDLYPYWERERAMLFEGLDEVVTRLRAKRSPEEVEAVFHWVPGGGRRSISDTLRHMAYVEHYIIDKLILDREPKTILPGSLFPREDYPTYDDVIRLMHEVHETTIAAYETLTPEDLKREIPAFRKVLPIERLLWSIVQEEAHHRGQVYLLLRMQGIPPPQRTD